jgi:hypothetical protein
MKTVAISLPHPVVFVFDPKNRAVRIPEIAAGNVVAFTDSCIAVGAQASVDGDVTLQLTGEAVPFDISGLHRVFLGKIRAPGRRLGLVTSENVTLLDCSVATETPDVEIWIDDHRWPSRIIAVTG